MKKEPWNLSDEGKKNIIESLKRKLSIAGYHLECDERPNTIINIDCYEHTILCWALQEFKESKQVPKKIEKIEKRLSEWGSPFICAECGSEQTPTKFFTVDGTEPKEKITWCSSCGQKLDWGDQNG